MANVERALAMANDALRIRICIWLTGQVASCSLSHFERVSGSGHRYIVLVGAGPTDPRTVGEFLK